MCIDLPSVCASLWSEKTRLYYIVNTMTADDLATQRSRASAAIVLTWY